MHRRLRRALFGGALALGLGSASGAAADGVTLYDYDGSFEDAVFDVREAIVGKGLVIDYVSHVGKMLKRTKGDVGGSKALFANADIFLFCSAVVSRKVMEADPRNIAHCPYGVFVTETAVEGKPGKVQIGFRQMPAGPMKEVEALLDGIAKEAAGG